MKKLCRTMKSRGGEFVEALHNAETYLALREEIKFEYLKGYALLRKLAVAIELKLQWKKGLIFYLTPKETRRILLRPTLLLALAKKREKERDLLVGTHVPPVVSVKALERIDRKEEKGNGTLKGIGVTNAVKIGEVVVVKSLDEHSTIAKLKPGSILVTEQTDPAWAPALSIVGAEGGLVIEVGGLLAHGAIYAREIGFAAVLNVPRATHILKTGMRVEVNGAKGTIKIIS